jgi:hypothetical protein
MMLAQRTKSYAAALVADPVGILTTTSTSTSTVTHTVFNGAQVSSGRLDLPRTVTITLSNTAGAFTTDPIVITGTRGGSIVTEELTPATVDGNETLRGTQIFDTVTSVALPEQGSGAGSYTIGVQDICAPENGEFCGVELHATGTMNIGFGGGNTDAIPVGAAQVGFVKPIRCQRVLTSSALAAPTTVGVTVYLP